jgi:hypothetical protein
MNFYPLSIPNYLDRYFPDVEQIYANEVRRLLPLEQLHLMRSQAE